MTDPVRRVVILGATSAIAEAVARRYASEGTRLFLVARSRERLEAVADDLRTRGAASVVTAVAELSDPAVHARLLDGIWSELGGIDIAVIAYGVLPDQAVSQRSWAASEEAFRVNFTSPCALLHELANRMEPAGAGVICVIGSVAGDRGRMSNYVYGSAKGGLALYAQGLRHRLAKRGVSVVVIKPGFVDTPMTAGLPKGPLFASPARVAGDICRGIKRGSAVVYTPWWWRLIMLVIRTVPDRIFVRTKL